MGGGGMKHWSGSELLKNMAKIQVFFQHTDPNQRACFQRLRCIESDFILSLSLSLCQKIELFTLEIPSLKNISVTEIMAGERARESGRDRETERERHTQIETETERETDRERDRQIDRERERERHRGNGMRTVAGCTEVGILTFEIN